MRPRSGRVRRRRSLGGRRGRDDASVVVTAGPLRCWQCGVRRQRSTPAACPGSDKQSRLLEESTTQPPRQQFAFTALRDVAGRHTGLRDGPPRPGQGPGSGTQPRGAQPHVKLRARGRAARRSVGPAGSRATTMAASRSARARRAQPLHEAAIRGDLTALSGLIRSAQSPKALSKYAPALPDADNPDSDEWFANHERFPEQAFYRTPLYLAAHGGHTDCVNALIAAGADLAELGVRMISACRRAKVRLSTPRHGPTRWHAYGSSSKQVPTRTPGEEKAPPGCTFAARIFRRLVAATPRWDVDIPWRQVARLRYGAVQSGHMEVVDLLIAHGANLNIPDYCGWSPLWISARESKAQGWRPDWMFKLLRAGADIGHLLRERYSGADILVAREILRCRHPS